MIEFWDGFWTFAGHYWWLVFPLMGVAGGVAKSWERGAKRRHERRMEALRLKGEIKAAQFAARNPTGAIAAVPVVPASPVRDAEAPRDLLQRLFTEHDGITARWLDYELDVAKVIAYPAMSDGRQPLTAAFLRAKKAADALRPSPTDTHVTERRASEYLDAVGNYAVAFEIAEKDARRLRDSSFTENERKRLERAQHMLKVAVDESATSAERQTAYRRVREELDGLIDLSDAAVQNLEKKVALQLGPSASRPAPAAQPADAQSAPDPRPAPQPDPLPRADR